MKRSRVTRSQHGLSKTQASAKSNQPSWRVFCGFEIPENVGHLLEERIRQLRSKFPDVSASWNREGKFHLTLKFLGHISPEAASNVSLAAKRATKDIAPIRLAVEEAGAFPRSGPPRVLWIGVEDESEKLSELQARLDEECARFGFAREERRFHPHLTLARLRRPEGTKKLASFHRELGFSRLELTLSELYVFRSELSPNGARYSTLSAHELRGI